MLVSEKKTEPKALKALPRAPQPRPEQVHQGLRTEVVGQVVVVIEGVVVGAEYPPLLDSWAPLEALEARPPLGWV